jgi:hypothetical protein
MSHWSLCSSRRPWAVIFLDVTRSRGHPLNSRPSRVHTIVGDGFPFSSALAHSLTPPDMPLPYRLSELRIVFKILNKAHGRVGTLMERTDISSVVNPVLEWSVANGTASIFLLEQSPNASFKLRKQP